MTARTPIYSLRRVEKRYGEGAAEVTAVASTNLEIGDGEYVALVGPERVGEDDRAAAARSARPAELRATFSSRASGSRRMGDSELSRLRRTAIGFIFQQFNLIPTLTARQNVEVALAPSGVSGHERVRRADELLARSGWPAGRTICRRSSRAASSSGWRSRGRWPTPPGCSSRTSPPATSTPPRARRSWSRWSALWREQGLTVVIVTHDRAIAERAERVVEMRDGRIGTRRPLQCA